MGLARISYAVTLLCCSACASTPGSIQDAVTACERGARSVEVRDRGVVSRVLGMRESYSGLHEGFVVRFGSERRAFEVEDNAGITGPIPLRRGDAIALQGQLECNDRVIHWTHRDPGGRHQPGFINVHGNTYQ